MSSRVNPRKLKGFHDVWGDEMAARRHIAEVVRRQAWLADFQWLDTPALEYREVLLGVGGETDKQVYQFEDGGGRAVGLRYDLTVPLARFLSEQKGKYPVPWRKVQMGPVWRAEKPQKGRYREFQQCDFDIIGSPGKISELELLLVMMKCLSALNLSATLSLGHRKVLGYLLGERLGISSPEEQKKALIILDKLEKIGSSAVVEQLCGEAFSGSSSQRAGAFVSELMNYSSDPSSLEGLYEELGQKLTSGQAVAEAHQGLQELFYLRSSLNTVFKRWSRDEEVVARERIPSVSHVASDNAERSGIIKIQTQLHLARGLDYYTGLVFETLIDGREDLGSVSSGGRYDHLMERFSKECHCCVGGSLGVDRLVLALADVQPETSERSTVKAASVRHTGTVFLIPHRDGYHEHLPALAAELREAGLRVLYPLKPRALKKLYQQAAHSVAAWAVGVHKPESESENKAFVAGSVGDLSRPYALTLKNLTTKEQWSATLAEALERIKRGPGPDRQG